MKSKDFIRFQMRKINTIIKRIYKSNSRVKIKEIIKLKTKSKRMTLMVLK